MKIIFWYPFLHTWSSKDDTSTPILEDNNVADWYNDNVGYKVYGRPYDDFEDDYKTDSSEDGWLAYHSYL